MELLNTVMELAAKYLPMALALLGGCVVALAALSPLTKSTKDDKALALLRKVEAFLIKTVMPVLASRKATGVSADKDVAKAKATAAAKK